MGAKRGEAIKKSLTRVYRRRRIVDIESAKGAGKGKKIGGGSAFIVTSELMGGVGCI